ncbi:MAG TPA: hypothetical protein VGK59_21955 [Ohtaekwangia sp.]
MKFRIMIFACVLLISCNQAQKSQDASADSTALDSSSTVDYGLDIADEEEYLDLDEDPLDAEDDSITNAITDAINALSEKVKEGDYYTISSGYSGYESGSESTWYFDSQLNMVYCTGRWDMEGNSGSYTYYFEDNDLLAYSAEDQGQESTETTLLHSAFKPLCGLVRTSTETGEDIRYLDESAYSSNNASAKEDFRHVLDLIRSNQESADFTGPEVSIHIANVDSTNYGMEVTLTENYSISKILFDKLIKD